LRRNAPLDDALARAYIYISVSPAIAKNTNVKGVGAYKIKHAGHSAR
jgi:hypothetical protein